MELAGAESKVWTIPVEIAETADETQAVAKLAIGSRDFAGFGMARRNPTDSAVPRIGEELAAARALSELSHKLMEEASRLIEEHDPATVSGS